MNPTALKAMAEKKFILVWLLLNITLLPAFSQVLMLEKAYNHLKENEMEKSLEAIKLASKHESTAEDPKTWYLRGFIFKELHRTSPDSTVDYRKEALQSIIHCIELDRNHLLRKDCEAVSSFIYTSYFNDVIQYLNEGNYPEALNILEIFTADSTGVYYAEALYYSGYAHLMKGETTRANQFFQQALQKGYQDPLIYDQLANSYFNNQLYDKAMATVQEGRSLFPEDTRLQISSLNIFMAAKKYKEAKKVAENYLTEKPDDIEVMLVAGTIYEKIAQTDTTQRSKYIQKRKDIYLNILQIDPDNSLANYNMGITLYNQAVNLINGNDVYNMDILAFDQLLSHCSSLFKEALPYIKKAHELSPDNINTLKALEGIYYNLNDRERFSMVREKLEALN